MATADERIENLEGKYSDLHTVVNVLATNVNNLSAELKDFKQEMRDRDNQRHAEITAINQQNAEIRQSIKEIYQATDDKIARIEAKVDSTNKHISNFFYTSLVAIGAMLLTVILNLPKG